MRHTFIGSKRTSLWLFSTLLILCLLLTACNVSISTGGNAGSTSSSSGSSFSGSGSQNVQLYIEPDDGVSVITNAIDSAQKSVWLEMYLLTDTNVIHALENAAQRGVDVRVMLERHPYGSGAPTRTLDELQAAGVKTQTSSPGFALTHEKGMVIDGKTAFIMTSNFTRTALGDSKSYQNREYGIIDTNAQDVQTVASIFVADWNRSSVQMNDANLVVSPINSRTDFLKLINSAHHTLAIEAEEMDDSQVEQAIVSAGARGVQVEVIVPSSSSSSTNRGISAIQGNNVKVEEDAKLYMHAKIIIVDGQIAFVGSENISTASLNDNREMGIIVSDQGVLSRLEQTFQTDWSVSRAA